MEQWWKRNEGVMEGDFPRGGYTKAEIEDFTGGIPLFLDNCVVKDKEDQRSIDLGTDFFIETYHQAAGFETDIKKKYKGDLVNLQMYSILVLPQRRR
jgi:hypothetical protein